MSLTDPTSLCRTATMDLLPPIAELTTDDRGHILIVYTYILVINTLLFTSIKVFSTVLLKRKLDWDDFCASAAGILALVQSIVTERSAINGAGRFQESLSRHDLEIFSKVGCLRIGLRRTD